MKLKSISFRSLLTWACASLFLFGASPAVRAEIPAGLQGNYQLKLIVLGVNGHTHHLALSAAAKAAEFPVTGTSLGDVNSGLLFAKIGLHWAIKVRKESSTSLTGTVAGDFHLPGTRLFVQHGTLAIRLSRAHGGTLLYSASLRGYRQRGERREPFYVTLNITLVKEA